MTRIAIAGFQHETNSFGTGNAGLAEFEMADSWPGLLTGGKVISGTLGLNLPIAGAIETAEAQGADLHPILWASAEPSGHVTDAAFATIAARILSGINNAQPLDGLYLDLHGAMITDSHDDGEGALLSLIRNRFGPALPIAISLDMHANVTPRMVELADSISIFRTYPHLDMAETGARAMTRLLTMTKGNRPARAFRQLPYLIPMHAQFTGAGAPRRLYDAAIAASDETCQCELAVGFPAGDIPDCGPSIVTHAPTPEQAEAAADALLTLAENQEPHFNTHLPNAEQAVAQALAAPPGKPVILADVQDNPGGGTSSDTTGLLRALVAAGATDTLLGVMHDPAAAATAHRLGLGASFDAPLGGRSGIPGDSPFTARFQVDALSDGTVTYEGEMYGGGRAEIGPCAVLCPLVDGTRIAIVVSSVRNQCLDRGYFRHIGLTPENARIIAVKSTVHYRADFEPISQAVIPAAAPGHLMCDHSAIPYRKLRHGLRLHPLGPAFQGENAKY